MAESGSRSTRARMDRSLDEIAAEMRSPHELFEREYGEEGGDGMGPHRGHYHRSSAYRFSPYTTGHGPSWKSEMRRGEGEVASKRLFVANLSYAVTWQRLKDFMRQAGPVDKCDIFSNPDGSSRGMGLVVFADGGSAQRALQELNGAELDGRRLYLREDMKYEEREGLGISNSGSVPRPRPPPNPSATVFVANLDYNVTWQKLKDVYKVAGPIVYVEIQSDKDGRSKGCGVVQFESQADALNAIALFHGQMLMDRPMTVRMDAKSDYRPDPLDVKFSMGAGAQQMRAVGGASTGPNAGGINLQLLAAVGLSSLSPEQLAVLTNPSLLQQLVPAARRVAQAGEHHTPSPLHAREREVEDLARGQGLSSHDAHPPHPPYPSHSPPPPTSHRSDGNYGYKDQVPHHHDNQMPSGALRGRKLFVKNLHFKTTWQRLKDVFRRAGSVGHVDIFSDVDGRSRGCAIITFDLPGDAERAIAMFNNVELDGRKLEVRYDTIS